MGGVSERFMVAVLKTAVSGHRDRGFESHPLRFNFSCVKLRTAGGMGVSHKK